MAIEPVWISVDEMKPNDYETVVIFCYYGGTIYRDRIIERITNKHIAQYHDGAFYVDGEEETCVTHWLRLPEAPIIDDGIVEDSSYGLRGRNWS